MASVLATWFGCGYSPVAPGTVGTLAAIPLYLAIREAGPFAVLGVSLAIFIVGVWAAGVVARETKLDDPQTVVIDEVAGVLIALSVARPTWPSVIVGVLPHAPQVG